MKTKYARWKDVSDVPRTEIPMLREHVRQPAERRSERSGKLIEDIFRSRVLVHSAPHHATTGLFSPHRSSKVKSAIEQVLAVPSLPSNISKHRIHALVELMLQQVGALYSMKGWTTRRVSSSLRRSPTLMDRLPYQWKSYQTLFKRSGNYDKWGVDVNLSLIEPSSRAPAR